VSPGTEADQEGGNGEEGVDAEWLAITLAEGT